MFLLQLHKNLFRVEKSNNCHSECTTTSETTHRKNTRSATLARIQIHPLARSLWTLPTDSKLLRKTQTMVLWNIFQQLPTITFHRNQTSLLEIRPQQPLWCKRRSFPCLMRMFTWIKSAKPVFSTRNSSKVFPNRKSSQRGKFMAPSAYSPRAARTGLSSPPGTTKTPHPASLRLKMIMGAMTYEVFLKDPFSIRKFISLRVAIVPRWHPKQPLWPSKALSFQKTLDSVAARNSCCSSIVVTERKKRRQRPRNKANVQNNKSSKRVSSCLKRFSNHPKPKPLLQSASPWAEDA